MKVKNYFKQDKKVIYEKIREALSSVLPIILIVLILSITFTPINSGMFLTFILGSVLVVVGIGLFTLGADTGMTPIGQYVGSSVIKTKKIWVIMPVCFVVGVLITISEPDLQVLGGQLANTINPTILILAVGLGVGVFLVIAFLRMVLKIKLLYILLFCYGAIFVLSYFVPPAFVPLAFDSGGVTTGPMSVPFIIAIGTGIATMRSDGNAETDGFGYTALCSIGPIIAVMILGIIVKPTDIVPPAHGNVGEVATSVDLATLLLTSLPQYIKEVAIALLPIVAFFFIFRIFGSRVGKEQILSILIGVLYTCVGLVLFLVGVNIGFLPIGSYIGSVIAKLPYSWIMVPIGFIMGFFVVSAEPAVHVLTKQVNEITAGGVPKKALSLSLSIGVGISIALAMLRIVLNIPIMYIILPGYLIALVLTFFVPDIFTAIAFDSGGVASGAMTAGFMMPLALGFCAQSGANLATQGFGLVALVAMTPLITIQILGLIFKIKSNKLKKAQSTKQVEQEEIIG